MNDERISREELSRILASRALTPEQEQRVKDILKIEASDTEVKVPNGYEFLRNLRKEAKRQKSMKLAEGFEVQAKDISQVPNETLSTREELLIAETFEIIEE